MVVSVEIFHLTCFLREGKGRGRRKSSIDFLKAPLSVPGGCVSLRGLRFPRPRGASEAGWAPWRGIKKKTHASFTARCSDCTLRHKTLEGEKMKERKWKEKKWRPTCGLATPPAARNPPLPALPFFTNKGQNTLTSGTQFLFQGLLIFVSQ